MSQFDERQFLKDYQTNPLRAFRALMDAFRDRVFLMCRRVTRSDMEAEDLAQEVFIRAWRGLERFKGDSSLSTWMYRIAWNVCASELQRRGNAPVMQSLVDSDDEQDNPRDGTPVPGVVDEEFAGLEKRQYIEVLFRGMSETHRLILTLNYMHELSYEEIAKVTGWPMGTVKATLHRARAKLREAAQREQSRSVA